MNQTRKLPRQLQTGSTAWDELRPFLAAAVAILAIRILALWFNNSELFFDEAQYWLWGKEPAFGYFSKPPLLGWILGATTAMCGDSEFCVRLASPLLHTVTGLVLFMAARRLFDEKVALAAGLVWLLLPAVSLSSALISTDVPLLLCWSFALWALIEIRKGGNLAWYLLLALAFGLGLNAKYAMAYFLLCLVIHGLTSRSGRQLLTDWRIWAAILAGIALLVPNILWQMDHQFTTVTHTGDNIGWRGEFPNLGGLGEFLGSQFGVAGPVVFSVYCIAVIRLWREGMSDEHRLLVAFSLPVLLLIAFQAVMSKAFANWAATAYPAAVLLVADLFVNRMPAFWYRLSNGLHASVLVVLSILTAFAMPGQLPIADTVNPFNRMWGGRELAEAMANAAKAQNADAILSEDRKRSATLTYYLRDSDLPVFAWRAGNAPQDHYELTRALQDDPDAPGRRYVLASPWPNPPRKIASAFSKVVPAGEVAAHDGSDKQYWLFVLGGYHGN